MINNIACRVETVEYNGGREHLDVFVQARKIVSLQRWVSL